MSTADIYNMAIEIWGAIFCVLAIIIIYYRWNVDKKTNEYLVAMFTINIMILLSDAFGYVVREQSGIVARSIALICYFILYVSTYILLALFTDYLTYCIRQHTKVHPIFQRIVHVLVGISVLLLIISQFNGMYYYLDEHNMYYRGDWFVLSQLMGVIGIFIDIVLLVHYWKDFSSEERIKFCVYLVLPMVAILIQIYMYGVALLNIATTTAAMIMFTVSQAEQSRKISQYEKKMRDMRVDIMMSQIQPHFLYNSLTTIKRLCKTDPDSAATAVEEFSYYLRSNMDSLAQDHCISFVKELEHVQNYLSLEKRRFGERLTITYHIEVKDFEIPALTLEPIVENAVKYGMKQNLEGVVIQIKSSEDEAYYYVTVTDNGQGFDPSEKKEDGKSHVGIENVKYRLDILSDGELIINSEIGSGTEVVIRIPKKG